MRISSGAFADEGWIPVEHSVDGSGSLAPLEFADVPDGARSLALVVHDPDVPRDRRPDGNFDHWVVWNIPPKQSGLSNAADPGGVVGANSRGAKEWVAPAPPPGDGPHRYYFTLYALDTLLDLASTAGRSDLEAAIEGHVLDRAVLMGKFER
ncbi:YbhB/YbcL family Raf kinase inhibitor-like protein [Antrihabitans sp. YC2-6]|uniref:YbhB/YbcL family Raf kinase inhibitor-like protein n=1 Tax=Antrihabitans sp. YC2-6 TaxID=2799498 RepID=UPI0018F38629|nr:YbhB/YbcL family Raf kinase inhibitor-like protein [Antrihabitans sp. YC2-6]MBJ8347967.1 YbhB/YbcL family Raf kinase inhibitor-like protein [Antrihabitans sp. YC2-6]